jgi:hypothetical protein
MSNLIQFLPLIIFLGGGYLLYRAFNPKRHNKIFICIKCKTQERPHTKTPGSLWIEIILWLCFLIPGLIYSVWRLTSRKKVCEACESPEIIPIDSPEGIRLSRQMAPLDAGTCEDVLKKV